MVRARPLDGQLGLFDGSDDESLRTCYECVHCRDSGDANRSAGLASCYLRHNNLAWQRGEMEEWQFKASTAQTCHEYMAESRRSIRELYNPFDRAMALYELLYPGNDRCIIFHRIWECCTVAYAQCPTDWFERSKSIRDVAQFIRDGIIQPRSMFNACYELGVFDGELDYHTCWDRCWAVKQGMPWHDAMKITEWDYGRKEPIA